MYGGSEIKYEEYEFYLFNESKRLGNGKIYKVSVKILKIDEKVGFELFLMVSENLYGNENSEMNVNEVKKIYCVC